MSKAGCSSQKEVCNGGQGAVASILQHHGLVPKSVCLQHFKAGLCSGHKPCWFLKWGRSGRKDCPFHGGPCHLGPGHELHRNMCAAVVDRIHMLDCGAVVIPEAGCLGGSTKRVGNRWACGPAYYIDVLGILSNGQVLAIEVDGDSHDNSAEYHRDYSKARALIDCGIAILRVDIRSVHAPYAYSVELHNVDQFIEGLMRVQP